MDEDIVFQPGEIACFDYQAKRRDATDAISVIRHAYVPLRGGIICVPTDIGSAKTRREARALCISDFMKQLEELNRGHHAIYAGSDEREC